MRRLGLGALGRISQTLTDIFVPRAIILLYHRVIELSSDPQLLCVSPQHFAEHLEITKTIARPIQLRALDQPLGCKRDGRCGMILTFDDGYGDNLYNVKPLLETYDVPATVFVATGYIGSQREFWKDRLERVFLQSGTLPEILRLEVDGSLHQWELGEAARYGPDDFERYSHWDVSKDYDPTPRQRLYRRLCQLLQPLPESEREKVLEALLAEVGMESRSRSTHRTLSADEVAELAKDGLVEIGSHTVTHPILAALSPAAQRGEIQRSKLRLEEILGNAVTSFAYPYGGRPHYTAETVAAVAEAGYRRACSNFGGIVRPSTDRWELPRFLVRDWDGEEFARRLTDWLRS